MSDRTILEWLDHVLEIPTDSEDNLVFEDSDAHPTITPNDLDCESDSDGNDVLKNPLASVNPTTSSNEIFLELIQIPSVSKNKRNCTKLKPILRIDSSRNKNESSILWESIHLKLDEEYIIFKDIFQLLNEINAFDTIYQFLNTLW